MIQRLVTPTLNLELPHFFPDATRGVVRTLDAKRLMETGIMGLMVNTLHLSSHPGTSLIHSLGGIHEFMGFPGCIAADSGGFQVFSLMLKDKKSAKVTADGFSYTLDRKKKNMLTPESCIQKQFRIQADIMFCLDYCTHPEYDKTEQRESVDITVRWAKRCKEEYEKIVSRKELARPPLLFAVVQGGNDAALRRECTERLLELGFHGYGYGGWPIGTEGQLLDSVYWVVEQIPPEFPCHALGIGKPENILEAYKAGYVLFDCVNPTREARHNRLYVFKDAEDAALFTGDEFYNFYYPLDKKYKRDARPIEENCDCFCCRNFSRAYLNHLYTIDDALAYHLGTIHNLRFYSRLIACLVKHGLRP